MITTSQTNFGRAAIQGTAWRYATFFSGKLMVFITTVVLARLLSKDEFGVVGFAVTTISFLDVVSDLGVAPALIYYNDEDQRSSTAYWLGMLISAVLFVSSWLAAPLIAAYFRDDRAIDVIRVLALSYPLNALGQMHNAVLRKRLNFNRIFISDLLAALGKGGISILLASIGFGPWSLIWGQLGSVAIASGTLWVIAGWRPRFSFNGTIARELLSYGLKVVSVDALGILLMNVDYLLVGRYLGAEALGVYTIAFRLPDLLILQFARILSTVIFPIYTRMREVEGGLAKGFAQTTRYNALLATPLGLGMALVAQPFILTVFTDKWVEIIPIVRAISLYALFLSLAYNAGSAYKAQGRPQVITWLSLVRLIILIPGLYWATAHTKSLALVGVVHATVAFIGGAINLIAAAFLLKLSARDIMLALRPAAVSGLIMVLCVLPVLSLGSAWPSWLLLSVAVLVGAVAYGSGLWLTERALLMGFLTKIRSALLKGRAG